MFKNRYALLIGNDNFVDTTLNKLISPLSDVENLKNILKDSNVGCFDKVDVIMNGDSETTRKSLSNFYSKRHKDDLLLLYYSGHGLKDKFEKLYLATNDTNKNDDNLLNGSSISASFIKELLDTTNSKKLIIILDCCFSGAFSKSMKSPIGEKINISNQINIDFNEKSDGYGLQVLTASDSIQFALDGKNSDNENENSLFTHYFIKGITSGEADQDNDGWITIDEIYQYAYKMVMEKTDKQTPVMAYTKKKGNLVIAKNPKLAKMRSSISEVGVLDMPETVMNIKHNIFPILTELNQTAFVSNLENKIEILNKHIFQEDIFPVVLLGLTGVGKTSLLNAILHENIGVAGGGQAQSAASLVISYQDFEYKTKITYLTLSELNEYADIIRLNNTRKDLFKRPDEQGLPENLKMIFSSLEIEESVILQGSLTYENIPNEIALLLRKNQIEDTFKLDEFTLLANHIKDHTNTRRKLWPITKEVHVSGPFKGIENNVQIIDLPGLGDLNRLRVEKAKEVLREANQIIVVLGERGFTEDIREVLGETQVISYLLTAPEIPQISIIGTKLDNTNINDSEIEELSLDDDNCEDSDIVSARFDRWEKLAKSQWKEMLTTWAQNTQMQGKNHTQSISNIIDNSDFIPTSPVGYLCLNNLEKDRKGKYKEIFPHIEGKQDYNNTGIPKVRNSIKRLSSQQKELKSKKIEHYFNELISSSNAICDIVISPLKDNLKTNINLKKQIDVFEENFFKHRYKPLPFKRENIQKQIPTKIKQTEDIIKTGWKDLDESAIQKILSSHLGKVHFQTIKASLSRKGVFTSSGKGGVKIDIPKKVGVYVVEPIASFIHEILIEFFPLVLADINHSVDIFTSSLKNDIEKYLSDQDILNHKNKINSLIENFINDVKEYIENNKPSATEFSTLDLAYDSIGHGFHMIMQTSLSVASGEGARDSAINTLIESSKTMMPGIIKESSKKFNEVFMNALINKIEPLYENTISLRNELFNQVKQNNNLLFSSLDLSDKERIIKSLEDAKMKLPSLKK